MMYRNLLMFVALLAAACHPAPGAATDVVVVGGGLAGLTAAYELQKSGVRVQMLEERPVLGGRVATAYYNDHLNDEYGMQEIWENNPLLQLARELQVPLDTPESAFSSVVLDGRIWPLDPNQPAAFFTELLGAEEAQRLHAWLDRAKVLSGQAHHAGLQDPEVAALQEQSFAAWVQKSGLSDKAQGWLRLTIECEMAADWQNFSALSALLDMDMFFGAGLPNYHVRGGNQRVIDALAGALHGPITLGAQVNGIIRKPGPAGDTQVTVRYEQNHKQRTLTARRVVLAIPFVRLHQLYVDPPLPPDYWMGINSLTLGQYVVVHLHTSTAARSLYDDAVFPLLTAGPLGVVYGTTRTDSEGSQDIFGLLVYGEPARRFHMIPREAKVEEIKQALHTLWPGLGKYVQEAYVYSYHPTALPVWPPGRSSLDLYAHTLRTPHQGIHLAGDYTRGAHATGAVQSGLDAARAVVHSLRDLPAPMP